MTETSTARHSLIPAAPTLKHLAAPAPIPSPDPARAKAAIKRCCNAWKRSFDASMEELQGQQFADVLAAHTAGKAYCSAMPVLSGQENIRDFIACTAHGMLIGAIAPQSSGQLLYAAQVALATLPR